MEAAAAHLQVPERCRTCRACDGCMYATIAFSSAAARSRQSELTAKSAIASTHPAVTRLQWISHSLSKPQRTVGFTGFAAVSECANANANANANAAVQCTKVNLR